MKILIDTNIFIRFATRDIAEKAVDCQRLFDLAAEGKITPYISVISFFEINFVLQKSYGFPKRKTMEYLEEILKIRNLTVLKEIDIAEILNICQKNNVSLADSLIVSQMKKDFVLCTYDVKLSALVKNSKEPDSLIA